MSGWTSLRTFVLVISVWLIAATQIGSYEFVRLLRINTLLSLVVVVVVVIAAVLVVAAAAAVVVVAAVAAVVVIVVAVVVEVVIQNVIVASRHMPRGHL